MARKARGTAKKADARCRLTRDPTARRAADMGTDAIRDRFPPGLSRPALRALQAAGFARLEQLVRISESELAELHGIGLRAEVALRAALRDQGLAFRAAKPGRGTARH